MLTREQRGHLRLSSSGGGMVPPPIALASTDAPLSFAYSLLTRAWMVALTAVGFDAFRGL